MSTKVGGSRKGKGAHTVTAKVKGSKCAVRVAITMSSILEFRVDEWPADATPLEKMEWLAAEHSKQEGIAEDWRLKNGAGEFGFLHRLLEAQVTEIDKAIRWMPLPPARQGESHD